MVTNNFFKSSLNQIHSVVQNSMTLYPKELIVATLRDFFSKDVMYHYAHDHWGYPQTPSQAGLPLSAGFNNDITTRLFIGESYRFDVIYYPAILVRHGGSTSVPISMNRETGTVKWGNIIYEDDLGNSKIVPTPEYFIFAGAWEGSINIDVLARDLRARDDLVDLISLLFVDIAFNDMVKSGVVVKGVAAGSPTETDDRNDHIFKQTITLQIRGEWRRALKINNIIEIINFSVEFGSLEPNSSIAEDLTINTSENLMEILSKI